MPSYIRQFLQKTSLKRRSEVRSPIANRSQIWKNAIGSFGYIFQTFRNLKETLLLASSKSSLLDVFASFRFVLGSPMSIFRCAVTCQAVPEVSKPAAVEAEPEEPYIDTWPIQSMEWKVHLIFYLISGINFRTGMEEHTFTHKLVSEQELQRWKIALGSGSEIKHLSLHSQKRGFKDQHFSTGNVLARRNCEYDDWKRQRNSLHMFFLKMPVVKMFQTPCRFKYMGNSWGVRPLRLWWFLNTRKPKITPCHQRT